MPASGNLRIKERIQIFVVFYRHRLCWVDDLDAQNDEQLEMFWLPQVGLPRTVKMLNVFNNWKFLNMIDFLTLISEPSRGHRKTTGFCQISCVQSYGRNTQYAPCWEIKMTT